MSVVNTAESMLGKVKYVFGANSITSSGGKADCSSFTQWVFAQNGIAIGRTANEQYRKGTSVAKKDLQPGDLVFFQGTYNTAGASHVGIYIGNNKFVHNSSGKGEVTTSELTGYYSQHYLGAKRYDGSESAVGTSQVGDTSDITYSTNNNGFFHSLAKKITLCILMIVCIIVAYLSFSFAFDLENPFK